MAKRRGDFVTLDEFVGRSRHRRRALVPAARGPDQTITVDVDLAREKSEKNPVYYVQYAHAALPESCGTQEAAVDAEPPAELARRSATSSSAWPSSPPSPPRRPSGGRRPTYAIRLADDFHRFYHHHRVLESEEQAFRLALVTATKAVIARSLDLVGVEAPERM